MRTTFLLSTVLLLLVGTTSLAIAQSPAVAHNTWTSGAPMPTAVWAPAGVAVLEGSIYVVGGYSGKGYSGIVADTQIYNPATNTWTTGVPLPTPIAAGAAAVVNNILFVFGGTGAGDACARTLNTVWAYNPKTNSWSSKSPFPLLSCFMGVAVKNNVVYLIGGVSDGYFFNRVESYNPATDTWTEEAPLLYGKYSPSVGLIGTTIVAADGFGAAEQNGDNEAYKVSTNTWTSLTPDPTGRNAACSGAVGTNLYVAGGTSTLSYPVGVTESFTLSKNSWKTLAGMPEAAMFPGSAVYRGLLYCFGGMESYLVKPLVYVRIYQP